MNYYSKSPRLSLSKFESRIHIIDENERFMLIVSSDFTGTGVCFGEHVLVCTDLDKSYWTFISGAYFAILCCTKTYHNLTGYLTITLVLIF